MKPAYQHVPPHDHDAHQQSTEHFIVLDITVSIWGIDATVRILLKLGAPLTTIDDR